MASFKLDPEPTGPTCSTRRHICCNSGITFFTERSSPPTKPNKVPSLAGPTVPPTGHSTNSPPAAITLAAKAICVSGRTVLISISTLPFKFADKIPFGPEYAASIAIASVSTDKVISAACATMAGEAIKVAPNLTRGSAFSGERFQI